MSGLRSFGSQKFNTNEVRICIRPLLCILLIALLTETNGAESNNFNSYQSANETPFIQSLEKEVEVPTITNKLVCFYVLTRDFKPEIMDGLCTHIHVGFFSINRETYELEMSSDQEQLLENVLLLKEKSKNLKINIVVGGAGAKGFSAMVLNHTTRKKFIKSCLNFVKKFKADGIDLDWEWPVVENGNEKEKVKFVKLLQEIQVEFSRHKRKYILTVDVPAAQTIAELGYLVKYIALYVDYVSVMCYDYHYFTKFFPFTGHNAPLYSNEKLFFNANINSSIFFWISNAMPREKIVMGMPTYGHTYKLIFPHACSLVAPAKGFGSVGQEGFAGYKEICQFLKNKSTTTVYDKVSKTPYAYKFPEWISFDDEKSLAVKASYVLKEKLAGAMVFSVNADDFTGSCKGDNIPLPLIRKVRNILFNEV